MSKHTPGPWKVGNEHGFNANYVYANYTQGIAMIYGIFQSTSVEEAEKLPMCSEGLANARLIAAAPDLLEALETVKKMMDQEPVDFAIIDEVIHQAIAKATGA